MPLDAPESGQKSVHPMAHGRGFLAAFAACLILSAPCLAAKQERTVHPLITKENDCFKSAKSSVDIIDCYSRSIKDWEVELNKVYDQVMKSIDLDEKAARSQPGYSRTRFILARKALVKSQRAWLAYREQEKAFLRSYYDYRDGTIWPSVNLDMIKEITVSRVRDLYRILESRDLSGESSKHYSFDNPE